MSTYGKCIEGDCQDGHGTMTLPGGTRYVGEFKNGRFHGHGILTSPGGMKYEGYDRPILKYLRLPAVAQQ